MSIPAFLGLVGLLVCLLDDVSKSALTQEQAAGHTSAGVRSPRSFGGLDLRHVERCSDFSGRYLYVLHPLLHPNMA